MAPVKGAQPLRAQEMEMISQLVNMASMLENCLHFQWCSYPTRLILLLLTPTGPSESNLSGDLDGEGDPNGA